MKVEEYIDSLKLSDSTRPVSKQAFEKYAKEDFEAGYEACKKEYEEKLRWIPVEERLPKEKSNGFSDLVITTNLFGNLLLERYDYDAASFNAVRHDSISKNDGQVTHWREINA